MGMIAMIIVIIALVLPVLPKVLRDRCLAPLQSTPCTKISVLRPTEAFRRPERQISDHV